MKSFLCVFFTFSILFSLECFSEETSTQKEIYKHIDSQNGVVQYTDQKLENSEAIKLPTIQIYDAPPVSLQDTTPVRQSTSQEVKSYQITLTEPKSEQVFTSDITDIVVFAYTFPTLQNRDKIQLYVDGAVYGGLQENGHFTVTGLYRGAHKIKAEVVVDGGDQNGLVKGKSEEVTIYQQRQFIRKKSGE